MSTEKDKISRDLQKWVKKGAWKKAISAVEQLSELEPQNPVLRLRKGDYCLKAGAALEAIRAYHKAASTFASGGFVVKALAAYKIILRLDPQDSRVHEQMKALHAQARESVKKPFLPVEDVAPAQESVVPARDNEKPVSEEIIKKESFLETDPELLDEGVVGVQPLEFEEAAVPAREPQPSEEPVEMTTSVQDFEIERTFEAESPTPPSKDRRVTDAVPLFSSLSQEEFGEFVKRMIHLQYPPDYQIIREGDKGDSVFVISQGEVKVITHIGGREIQLTNLRENDFFGEVAFLTGSSRAASVITTENAEILELQGKDLRAIVQRFPAVKNILEDFYQARIRDTIDKAKSQQALV